MPQYRIECSRILETLQWATIVVTASDEDHAIELADAAHHAAKLVWRDDEHLLPDAPDERWEYECESLNGDDAGPEEHAGIDAEPGL